jgi:hypothetical protein
MKIIEANHDTFFKNRINPWSVWGENEVQRIHELLGRGKIIDLWFWVGRHVKQLLDLWYSLTWIDVSEIWYLRLQKDLEEKKQISNLYHGDMFEFEFSDTYDCIFSNMSLQYAKNKQQFSYMIDKMQSHTNIWGINYIKLPAQWMSLEFPYKILDLDALKAYYEWWEILFDKFEKEEKEDWKIWIYVTIIAKKI